MLRAGSLNIQVNVKINAFERTYTLETDVRALGITGPSGTGKSVLLRILAGVESRITGTIVVRGEVWQSRESGMCVTPWKRRTGWAPQDALLFPHRSVRENLVVAAAADPAEMTEIARALEILHLLDRAPRHLSGGERQRVAVGRALCARPTLLLLDEPFAALDVALRSRVREFLLHWIATHDVTSIIVSHDENELAYLCDETLRFQ